MLNPTPKVLPFLLFAALCLGLLAFKSSCPATQVKPGTCSYTSDADKQLLLQLNNDNTFRYINNTNPDQPLT